MGKYLIRSGTSSLTRVTPHPGNTRILVTKSGGSMTFANATALGDSIMDGLPPTYYGLRAYITSAETLNDVAVSGQSLQTAASGIAATIDAWPDSEAYFVHLGWNDAVAARTAAQMFADLQTIANAVVADGQKFYYSGIIPAALAVGWTQTVQDEIDYFLFLTCEWMRGQSDMFYVEQWSAFINTVEASAAADLKDATYASGNLHLSEVGAQLGAANIDAVHRSKYQSPVGTRTRAVLDRFAALTAQEERSMAIFVYRQIRYNDNWDQVFEAYTYRLNSTDSLTPMKGNGDDPTVILGTNGTATHNAKDGWALTAPSGANNRAIHWGFTPADVADGGGSLGWQVGAYFSALSATAASGFMDLMGVSLGTDPGTGNPYGTCALTWESNPRLRNWFEIPFSAVNVDAAALATNVNTLLVIGSDEAWQNPRDVWTIKGLTEYPASQGMFGTVSPPSPNYGVLNGVHQSGTNGANQGSMTACFLYAAQSADFARYYWADGVEKYMALLAV